MNGHISELDLERHYLHQITEDEMAPIEEHLLWCPFCLDRLQAIEVHEKGGPMLYRFINSMGSAAQKALRALSDQSR
jgi:hypothetical protein